MNNLKKLIRLNELFIELKKVLIRENENNYVKGIDAILSRIHYALEDNEDAKETIKSPASSRIKLG
ncbi:hypothetical protein [Psychrobacter sp. LV10R520-6]|uniref:hypothetical protein n=1 Tax=Psychrobacter sp. LV10R520-6 TaxID=1415574 RepID=UPI0024C5AE8C|nr:hypothetical protein [Psychrobacter sp. LV10R520-6]SNT71159.1 hypothetical protein SAMN04488491_2383 [Psychrobacter sp. LV10R520-6]